jgi:uncharacterized protein YqgV (UPF0045/DUF77 family)
METQAEVSIYTTEGTALAHPVQTFVKVLRDHGCQTEIGSMSTVVKGDSKAVFESLRIAYERTCEQGGCVMVVKCSNICPA